MKRYYIILALALVILNVLATGESNAQISGHLIVCTGASRTILTGTPAGGTWSSSNVSRATVNSSTGEVSGVASGTVTISYTTPSSVVHTAVVTVNHYVMSAIGFSMGSDVRCTGGATATCTVTPVIGNNWTSSNSSIATINTGGLLTPSASNTGIVTISYRHGYGNCYVTRNMTVNPTPTVSIATPVCAGLTQIATATPPGGTWMSTSISVGTINAASGALTALIGGGTGIRYTLGGCFSQPFLTVLALPAAISGITTLCVGNSVTLSSTTSGGTWSSNNGSVAIVGSSTGVVTGTGMGTTTISYIVGSGCFRTAVVTVNAGPSATLGPDEVCMGQAMTLTNATGGGSWSSSNTSKATVTTYGGIVTGIGAGTVTISYRIGAGCVSVKTVTVNSTMAAISGGPNVCEGVSVSLTHSISGGTWTASNANATVGSTTGLLTGVTAGAVNITYTASPGCVKSQMMTVKSVPASITGTLTTCAGGTTILSSASSGGTWSSSNTSVAVVGSSSGVVTGVASGAATVTYTSGSTGCHRTAVVTVSSLPDVGTITGPSSVAMGSTITLSDSVTGGVWSSSDPAVAVIGTSGVVSGISPGTVTISYTVSNSCGIASATRSLTVGLPAIAGTATVCSGSTTTLSNAVGGGTWSSSNTARATVGSATGVVSGVSAGTATISYSSTSGIVTIVVTVNSMPVLYTVTGGGSFCSGGVPVGLSNSAAGVTYQVGTGAGWLSSVTGTGSVISFGTMSVSGTYFARAINGACVVMMTGSVTATLVTSVSPVSGAGTVCMGNSTTLGSTTTGGTWSSSNTSVATVGSVTGSVAGVAAGTAIVSYSIPGCFDTSVVNVLAGSAAYSVTGGGSYCVGWTGGFPVGLSGSQSGINYTLYNGTTAMSAPVAGTGSALNFGSYSATGTYTVLASNPANGCTRTMTGLAGIVANPLPNVYQFMSGTGTYCGTGNVATLNGSQLGFIYQLYSGSTVATSVIVPSYSGVTFGALSTSGTYSVRATNSATGCVSDMYGIATVNTSATAVTGSITGGAGVCIGGDITLATTSSGGTWSSSNTGAATVDPVSGVVTGVSANKVTIRYALPPSGCQILKIMSVVATPGILSVYPVCVGSTATYIATPAGGTWSSSAPAIATVGTGSSVFTGVSPGTFNVSYALAGGCFATETVTALTAPATSTISGPSSIVVSATGAFSASESGGYWVISPTSVATVSSSTGVVTGVSPGTAVVSYVRSNMCGTTFSTYNVTVAASRPDVFYASNNVGFSTLHAYPNPTSGRINVETGIACEVLLLTIDGKVLEQYKVVAGITGLNLSPGLAAGVYILSFKGEDGSVHMLRLVYEP